jgi:histone deacetylase 8
VVLAILALRRIRLNSGPSSPPRILYLDLDLHYGDAVALAFSSTSSVLTLSIHHASPYFFPLSPGASLTEPDAPDLYTLSIPLARGASCDTFRRVWLGAVIPVMNAYSPDIIVAQLGADGLAGDPCKIWNWSIGGEGGFGWCVEKILAFPCKKLLLGGGMHFSVYPIPSH